MQIDREQRVELIKVAEGIRIIATPKSRQWRTWNGPRVVERDDPDLNPLVKPQKAYPEELVVRRIYDKENEVILTEPEKHTSKWITNIDALRFGGDDYFDFQLAPDDTPASKSDGLTL